MDDSGSVQLANVLSEDYESSAGDYASPYVKDLVVRTFSPLAATVGSKVDYQREVENHNAYLSLYTQAQKGLYGMRKTSMRDTAGRTPVL